MTTTKTVLSTTNPNLEPQLTFPLSFELIPGCYTIVRFKPTASTRFSFNFSAGTDWDGNTNLLYHFNPRFDQNRVVRNAVVQYAGWGGEEVTGTMPYKVGVSSETKIVVREDFFECFVDGVKHSEFNHRVALEAAKFFFINGDGEVQSVRFGDEATDEAKSQADLSTPCQIPCEISLGRRIYVSGIADADVNRFWVFVCADDDYAFVLVVKMKRKSVAINSRIGGKWKAKQRVKKFPFEAGQFFNILIEVDANKFQVSVNDEPLADFSHRVLPLSRINKVRVDERDGKLQLQRFDVE